MTQMTGAEFARLAYTARGFGLGGRMTLVEYIAHVAAQEAERAVAAQALRDAVSDTQKIVRDTANALRSG